MDHLTSNEQRYEIVGLTRKEAVACADLLAGGSALWVEGHAYPDSHLVVRPIRQPVEPAAPPVTARQAKIIANFAHAALHVMDDYGEENAQTGEFTVEIPADQAKELWRVLDLLGVDPHGVMHKAIGVELETDGGVGCEPSDNGLHECKHCDIQWAGASEPPTDVQRDAERWRALIGCARVRVLGSAGLNDPESEYAHIGLELWTRHAARSLPDAIETLTAFADRASVTKSAANPWETWGGINAEIASLPGEKPVAHSKSQQKRLETMTGGPVEKSVSMEGVPMGDPHPCDVSAHETSAPLGFGIPVLRDLALECMRNGLSKDDAIAAVARDAELRSEAIAALRAAVSE